jgi:hypothetical protein
LKLTKTDFIQYLNCPESLWLLKNKPEIYPKGEFSLFLEKLIKEGYEYDYIINLTNPPEIIFAQLKGYNSGATISLGDYKTKSSLKWFFSKTLPFGAKAYKN